MEPTDSDRTMSAETKMQISAGEDRWASCLEAIAAHGDRNRFVELYSHFAPRVKSYLIGMGAPRNQAEDLAQEAMLNVWRKAGQFRPERASAGTWIFRIARNLRIDGLRRGVLEIADDERSEEPSGDPEPSARADHDHLRSAIDALPALQAQTVYRSYFLGQSHSEIAHALQMPLGSVKSNLRLAFKALQRKLGVKP